MDTLLQDLRYSVRGLAKSPAFTAVVLMTLALGTGVNATVFSFVNALLLRPAPGVADPRSFVAIYTSDFSSGPYGSSSYPDFVSLKTETTAFDGLAASEPGATAILSIAGGAERVRVAAVSGDFFSVIGLHAAAGRLLGAADVRPDSAPAAVISDDLWQRIFGSDPATVGKTITLNGTAHTIVGIAPVRFDGVTLGSALEVWTPLADRNGPGERRNRFAMIVGRLKRGVSVADAQAQVSGMAARLARAYPETNRGTIDRPDEPRPMTVLLHTRLHPAFRSDVAAIGTVLLGAVILVLAIACANVASLMLSRATARSRDIAIRLALGAGRRRLLSQMLIESLVLGVAGGALGLIFALWTADILPSFFPAEQARLLDARIDARVLAYTGFVSLLASAFFGLAPALQALKPSCVSALRGDVGRVTDGRAGRRMRAALVVAQVALAMVLLVSTGLLVRSLTNALRADLGFATREAVVLSVEQPRARTAAAGDAYFAQVLERVRGVRGVTSATFAISLPLEGRNRRGFRMEGYEPRPGEDTELNYNIIEPRYFDTLRIPLVAGRAFDAHDREGNAPVAIVNDVLARRFFRGESVGRHLTDSHGTVLTIVGVVRSTRHRSVQEPPVPVVFYPLAQNYGRQMRLVAATNGDAGALAETVRGEVTATDRSVAVFSVTTLASLLAESLAGDRLTASLVATCGGLALLLALIGIYGVVAFAVLRRTREIGVRIALGAAPRQIMALVLGEGTRVVLAGVVLGLGAAAVAARLLTTLLYGVSTSDVATFGLVTAFLMAVAMVTASLPARRALSVDPVIVLRQE